MIDHVLLFDGPVIAPGARLGPMADVVVHKQVSLLALLRGAQHACHNAGASAGARKRLCACRLARQPLVPLTRLRFYRWAATSPRSWGRGTTSG